jgi:[CysO sulfur-carrier protein]-S-L-cysteine hydrolase
VVAGAAAGLAIPPDVADAMLAHARDELPNEACGIIAGLRAGGEAGTAVTFHAARNAEASPLRYSVHPDDLVRIVFEIEDAGQELLGIFHSHTRSPAIPSATDRRAAMYPDAFYVLASLADPAAGADRSLRAWRIHGGHAFEVPLRIVR